MNCPYWMIADLEGFLDRPLDQVSSEKCPAVISALAEEIQIIKQEMPRLTLWETLHRQALKVYGSISSEMDRSLRVGAGLPEEGLQSEEILRRYRQQINLTLPKSSPNTWSNHRILTFVEDLVDMFVRSSGCSFFQPPADD